MKIKEIKEIKPPQLECHCCTRRCFLCELDNCEYPLCSTCKEKVLKIEHKWLIGYELLNKFFPIFW